MQIRMANKKDKDVILSLVRKLADFEGKNSEDVQLTIDKIQSHGLSRKSFFRILIGEIDSKPVGYALYFYSYSASLGAPVLYLEDLFVEEEFRNRGFGKNFLTRLANLAIKNNCCRMEWHAFTWNDKAIQFYKSIGAEPKLDLIQFRLSGNNLYDLSLKK